MSGQAQKPVLDEAKIIMALVRRKVISDGQLKAAMDYQRSLGGKILDIIVKLDLVRPTQIEEALKNPDGHDASGPEGPTDGALDPASVKATDLKVHRRLLEKVPQDIVDRYLVVLFFPVPSGDPRKIVMGHGREITPEVVAKLHSILGVDLTTLALDAKIAKEFLTGEQHSDGQRRPAEALRADGAQQGSSGASTDALLSALVSVLVKKGSLTRQELEAELAPNFRTRSRVVPLKR